MSEIILFDKIEKILIDKGIYKLNKTSRGDFSQKLWTSSNRLGYFCR